MRGAFASPSHLLLLVSVCASLAPPVFPTVARNDANLMMSSNEKVILVVGACNMDRLLSVRTYPDADAKVRTTAYNEAGGGNAANTASAMALLKDAKLFAAAEGSSSNNSSTKKLTVKLLTKLGDDYAGKQLAQELQDEAGVDLSSPLFQYAGRGTTTGFATIIVSNEEFTRTCFYTPGTCGELTVDDARQVDLDEVFENVIHVHSDCRSTDMALLLAAEARRRGITVSVDAEKDRHIGSQHGLLELATTIFTNGLQLSDYFQSRTKILEEHRNRSPLPDINLDHYSIVSRTLVDSIRPSAFYLRWFGESQLGKDVVITKGSMGAIRIKPECFEKQETGSADIAISEGTNEIVHRVVDGDVYTKARYKCVTSGALTDVQIVDSTGAGDAFIGGYLVARKFGNCSVQFSLDFASWVGGKKLEGPGARSALPRAIHVDEQLGTDVTDAKARLRRLLGPFGGKLQEQL